MSGVMRDSPPSPGKLRTFSLPPVSGEPLQNGLGLRVVQLSRLPLVSTLLVLDAGESQASAGSEGVGALAGLTLQGGTRRREAEALAEALEGIGAALSVGTGWDSTTLGLTCHADRLEEAWSLLAELVLEPTFPEDEIALVRDRRLATLQQRRMSPGSLADDMFSHYVFSEESAYARPVGGTVGSLASMGSDVVGGWWQDRFFPAGASLIVVGDVDPGEMRGKATDAFGAWSAAGTERSAPPEVGARAQVHSIVVVDRPGAVQSEIRIGGVGVSRSFPETIPLKVFNAILGGVFTSRLNLNLREENGFTYGVRAGFAQRRAAGPFTIGAAVGSDVTAAAVRETHAELNRLLQDGPTRDEVASVRDFLAGIFPLQMETASRIASQLSQQVVYDLPDDYLATYRDRIREVEVDSALAAGRKALDPTAFTTLVVGDAAIVVPDLEALDLGPLQVVGEDALPPFYG